MNNTKVAKVVPAIEFTPSQAQARKYYEARLKALKEQDPIANKDEIESIEMLLMICE